MHYVKIITAIILALYFSTAPAQQLIYKGKPIDPKCFESPGQDTVFTNLLEQCTASQQIQKTGQNDYLIKKGFTGYDYGYDEGSFHNTASIYYKIIAPYKNAFIVQEIESGGGTATFEHLMLVKQDKQKIKLNIIMGCDRCGIDHIQLKDNLLSYEYDITPSAFVQLVDKKYNDFQKDYSDYLDSCAICGFARIKESMDLNDPAFNTKIIGVDLGEKIMLENTVKGKPYQSCFNQIMINEQKKGHRYLTLPEISQLVAVFKQRCAKFSQLPPNN